MATDQNTASHVHPNDRTDTRIRAYLASIRPMRDVIYQADIEEANQRGRALIERLALSAEEGDLPSLRLTAEGAADVLSFIHCSEPVDPATWWAYGEISHVCGFNDVLKAVEASLRELAPGAKETAPD